MFGMSVNDVPGWSVAMAPSAIGVPVAAWPGLVPHCEVLAVPAAGVPDALDVAPAGVDDVPPAGALLLVLLLQAAAARVRAAAAARIIVLRADNAGICL